MKVWDDNALLNGSGIGGGDSLWNALSKPFLGAYFRPLVSATFFWENLVWKGTPFLYHQTNILLHAAGSLVVVGLILEVTGSRRLALFGGAVFALAPCAVSTVAWIGGRTDSLCALLVGLFAYLLVKALRAVAWRRVAFYAASVTCFFLALLTKEQALAMAALVPASVWLFGIYDDPERRVQAVRWTIPFVLAACAFAALWFIFYPNPFSPVKKQLADQLLTAGHTGVYYSLLLLLPSGRWMHMLSLGNLQAGGWPLAFAGLCLWTFATLGCAWLLKRRNPAGYFALFTLMALLPVSNLIPLPSLLVAPYRAGVAVIGFAGLLAYGLYAAYQRQPKLVPLAGAAWLAWCGCLTFWGAGRWSDSLTIFETIIKEDPSSIVTRRNLSLELLNAGRPEESVAQTDEILTMLYGSADWSEPTAALAQYETNSEIGRKVQENQGNEVRPGSWLGELFAQRGFALARIHKYTESKKAFESALAIDRRNPRARVAFAQYALAEGRPGDAISQLRIAQALHPGDPAIYALEGHAYGEIGRYKLAEQFFEHSISMQPWFGPTYLDLAELQQKAGNTAGAIETLKAALTTQVRDSDEIRAKLAALQEPSSSKVDSQL